MIPFGSVGTQFVAELAKLYDGYGSASAMESITVMTDQPPTLLQSLIDSLNLVNILSVLNIVCSFGERVISMLYWMRVSQFSSTCDALVLPPLLTAHEYLPAWFFIRVPCIFSWNSLEGHFYLSSCQLGSPLFLMNFSRNILVPLQLLI